MTRSPWANPGEFDAAAHWQERGVRGSLVVRPAVDAVTRLERGWSWSVNGWLAVIRGWGHRVLRDALPPRTAGLAAALLLGEGAPLAASEWEKYVRTGVIHVLAISGQHLVIFGGVLWWVLRRCGLRQRRAAVVVGLVLLAYALVTGGRPPALRSAVMFCAASAGLVIGRRTFPANGFALAWLIVALLNPADLFTTGCQLSFLAVAVLYWGTRRLFERPIDPMDELLQKIRPPWQQSLQARSWWMVEGFAVAGLIWLAVTPLAAARNHTIPLVGFVLGVPLEFLTSIALLAGFVLLVASALGLPIAFLLVPLIDWPLWACERLVDAGDRIPSGYIYVGDIPDWWLAVFYLGLLIALTQRPLQRAWRWPAAVGLGWLCVGLLGGATRLPADELRVTFLAVGHGGCTVLQGPDGRTLLYDAGAIAGPDVARRQIAPFLWRQGVRRIDEVFLSHADLDHFNGLADLLSRFRVGRITCTPTFQDKSSPAVRHTLEVLKQRGLPIHIVKAGDRFAAGSVALEVLHPPIDGPPGNENARSLVLRVMHAGHSLLLTGDLEGTGMDQVLRLPSRPVDVLMAPHHGSRRSNTPEMARWARPNLVVSCQGPPTGGRERPEPYSRAGIRFLGTWPHGAITVRSHSSGLVVETFATKEHFVVRGRAAEN